MIGAYTFAGGRFVATRECKARRYPADSPIAPDPAKGSFLAVYWILAGCYDEWNRWAVDQVNWLHANGRMFTDRDHIHTLMYELVDEQHAQEDGVPAELALDHHFGALVTIIGEVAVGHTVDEITEWFRLRPCPADVTLTFTPRPLLDDAPGDVPRDTVTNRFLQLHFLDIDPLSVWDDRFAVSARGSMTAGSARSCSRRRSCRRSPAPTRTPTSCGDRGRSPPPIRRLRRRPALAIPSPSPHRPSPFPRRK